MIRTTLAFALFLAFPAAVTAQSKATSSCTTNCHGEQATSFSDCVHRNELSCVDCHGGNPAAMRDEKKSHDPAHGYIGKPARDKIPELCSRCHSDPLAMHAYGLKTDQLAHYKASGHGKALERGILGAAVCTDCHNTHHIRPAHDPRSPTAPANQPETCGRCHEDKSLMGPSGLSTNVVEEFRESVHGHALLEEGLRGAPSCTDCHGSHGATPPGVAQIVQVCGHCHQNTAQHYRESPHFASGEMRCDACHEEKTHEYRRAGCTSCHEPHKTQDPGEEMYTGDQVGHCGHCHREADDQTSQNAITVIRDGKRSLERALRTSMAQIREAKERGVFLENEKVYLRESARTLVSVRPLAHSLDLDRIREHLDAGLRRQDRAQEMIVKRTVVLRDRKLLMGALALLLLLLITVLHMKLKATRDLS